MKSLAHPDWPYTGTPWEWKGFAKEKVYDEFVADEYRRHVIDEAIKSGVVEENEVGMFVLKGTWAELDDIRANLNISNS